MTQYRITISSTADGSAEYLQIVSMDGLETNIVLIGEFEIFDTRPAPDDADG